MDEILGALQRGGVYNEQINFGDVEEKDPEGFGVSEGAVRDFCVQLKNPGFSDRKTTPVEQSLGCECSPHSTLPR